MDRDEGLLLGIDIGTSSTMVVVMDAAGTARAEATEAYSVRTPRTGWVESAPTDWWDAVVAAVRQATSSLTAPVVSVGVVGQMHGVVLTTGAGAPVRPGLLWADARAEAELQAFDELGSDRLARLGNPLVPGMAGPSLLWLRANEPDGYEAARWALQPKDWLRMQLTGQAVAEPSDASATLLYDLPDDDWAWWLIDELGLRRDLFPPLQPSSAPAGRLTEGAATALGLPAGLPVATGAADTAAAALGSGLLEPGTIQVTVGSGGQVLAPLDQPDVDRTRRTHTYRAAAPQRWYAMAATLNAGLALEWVRHVLGVEWDTLYDEACSIAPGAEGVRFLPYLSGERTPHLDPVARGAWSGLSKGHGRPHLLRAALEGVAFALRDCVTAVTDRGIGEPGDGLRIAGGGTREPAWRQLLADVLRRPLIAVETPNASARGAALLAGVAAGIYPDVKATLELASDGEPAAAPEADVYTPHYEDWRSIYRMLKRERTEQSASSPGVSLSSRPERRGGNG